MSQDHTKEETIRFSVSLPKRLYEEMDEDLSNKLYLSRSEYIRDLFRERSIDATWNEQSSEVVAVLCIVYDHHQRGLNDKLVSLQHNDQIQIVCNTHVHIDHHNCLENIVLKGNPNEIKALSNAMSALKGVKQSTLVKMTNS